MKSGNLNFLEPSGSLQACNGTALAFIILLVLSIQDKITQNVEFCAIYLHFTVFCSVSQHENTHRYSVRITDSTLV
jgi:hypothetical protein